MIYIVFLLLFNKPEFSFLSEDLYKWLMIFYFYLYLLSQDMLWKNPAINSWNVTHWNQGTSDCTAMLSISYPNKLWKDMSHHPLWSLSNEELLSIAFIVALETWGRDFYIKSFFLAQFIFTSSLFSIQQIVPVLIILTI